MDYLLKASKLSYGLTINNMKVITFEFAKKCGIPYPANWDASKKASSEWYYGFMKRHPNLSLRVPEQLSANRAKSFCKENVNSFFANLSAVITDHPFEPHRIWNVDESGFPTVPTKSVKVISQKGSKRVSQFASQERGTNVTMALAVSASGQFIPPFYIFPRKNMRSNFLDNASAGSVGYANESGWMTASEFVKYMQHFIKYSNASKDAPSLLLLDNHTSHLSIEALDLAVEHGITVLSFPPHCSHRMQPLDVTVFGPIKRLYTSQCDAWCKNNAGKVLEIQHVAGIVDKCLNLGLTPKNIKSGFEVTGIYPFNPDVFAELDFIEYEINGENKQNGKPLAHVILTDEEASTSASSLLHLTLNQIGPVQFVEPKKKSNRGRKAMKSAILTSPEKISELKTQADKRTLIKSKKKTSTKSAPAKKQRRDSSSSTSSEEEFCTICLKQMPKKLNRNNSVNCNVCKRPVHLKCANVTASYYTCVHCDSDYSDNE